MKCHLILAIVSRLVLLQPLLTMDKLISKLISKLVLKLVLAQRLVRRLCPACKTQDANGEYQAVGCGECQNNGYRGRVAIYEILSVDDKIRTMLANGAGEHEIEEYGFAKARKLADTGFELVKAGETTRAEIIRVARLPDEM